MSRAFLFDRIRRGQAAGLLRPGPPPEPAPPGEGEYAEEIGLRLAPGALEGTVATAMVLTLDLTDARLATSANGGKSLNNGLDIRIELPGGTVIPYVRDSYNAATGAFRAKLRLPAGVGASGLVMMLKIGDSDGADQSADPAIVFAGYLQSTKSDGSDRVAGRDYTLGTGVVANGEREDGITLPGDAVAAMGDAGWRAGSAICYSYLIKGALGQTGTNKGWHDQGAVGGTSNRGWVARNRITGIGGAANCVFFGEQFTGGFAAVQGPASSEIGTDWVHIAINFIAGETPAIYRNGRLAATTFTSAPTGTVAVQPGGLQLGKGAFDLEADGWEGGIAALEQRAYAYGPHEAALRCRMTNFNWTPFQLADGAGNYAALPALPDLDGGGSTPGDPTVPTGTTLPTPLRTVNVSNQAQFNSAYADATPGDAIVLQASGLTIPNSGNWAKSGTEANPIVIRADNLLARTIGGNFQVNASDVILYGLDLPSRLVAVGNNTLALRTKIWRCRWRDLSAPSSSIGLRGFAWRDFDIAYCEWVNWGGRGVSFGVASGSRDGFVRRCYFGPTPSANYTNAHEAVQVGFGFGDRPVSSGIVIYESLFESWNSDDEALSVKSSGTVCKRLRFINCQGRLANRMGKNSLFEAILFAGSAGIRIHDEGCEVLGCDVSSASQGLRIATGNFETTNTLTTSSSPSHPYALDTYCGGNIGTITVGQAFSGQNLDATGTIIREHDGTVTLVSGQHTGTDSAPGSPATGKSWVGLWVGTTADVGPSGV